MKKGWIIAISVIVAVIGLLVLLSFTVFSLKDIEIDWRTSKEYILKSDDEIIENANFKKGSVFFHGKKKYINQIEKYEPYIKVLNIETVFPSKFVIHVSERQEIFAVYHKEKYYICDDDFKVLRLADEFISDQSNSILLKGLNIADEDYAVGDFMDVQNYQPIYSALYENNRPLGEQKAMIESIEMKELYDENIKQTQPVISLKFFNGQTYNIINSSYGLKYKVNLMLEVFSQIYTYIGQTINVNGEDIVLSEENLKNATIEIRNYYDYREYGEEDCYFQIFPTV